MNIFVYLTIILTISTATNATPKQHKAACYRTKIDDNTLAKFLAEEYERKALKSCQRQAAAEWDQLVDIDNEEKAKKAIHATLEGAKLDKLYWKKYFRNLHPSSIKDINLRRQISRLSILGNAALSDEKLTKLVSLINTMTKVYSTAKICPYLNQRCSLEEEGISLDPHIADTMATSNDYDELLYLWKTWRYVTGAQIKNEFCKYVILSNEAAVANKFSDKGDMWRHEFDTNNFENLIEDLWNDVKPLYDALHKYVLNKLKLAYPDYIPDKEKLIPAHILGNMWAQNWLNIAPLVMPYPNETTTYDVTNLLAENNYTIYDMFEKANDFYISLGLKSNAISYDVNAGAVIEKPVDRNIVCHASAWDLCNGKDFRIKMCTKVNFEDFVIIHHEMGHITYYQLYKDQPLTFRAGANPGFHEAIGDTIALSVSTPEHLNKLGLLDEVDNSESATLNALMSMALERVAFLPFGYIIDKWRWDVFSGNVPEDKWNSHWWKYRESIQKVKAPIPRSDQKDFDPGSKFHIPADTQYISYFFAHILEFQLHRGLCKAAGRYKPGDKKKALHRCDIYGSKIAGNRIKHGLSLGASVHWTKVLEKMTGEKTLSGMALLEYFKPLLDYLMKDNELSDNLRR